MTTHQNNDFLVIVDELPWHSLGDGATFKLLRYSPETGTYVILLGIKAGGTFQAHKHLAAGEFFMTKGTMHYTDKVARVGDYGYEALGAYHHATNVTEDSELLFIGYGPLTFFNDDGSISFVLDGDALAKIAAGESSMVITQ